MKTKEQAPRNTKHKKIHKSASAGKTRLRWLITVFVTAMVISAVFSLLSQELLDSASILGAFAVLLTIIAIGILFDLLGVAVTAADERPFHSMAARKVFGAAEAIRLLRNAGKVSSICCDVVGDICGIISGTAVAVVAVEAFLRVESVPLTVLQLLLSAFVAALTICGKAFCKSVALENSTAIVHAAARLIAFLKHPFQRKRRASDKKHE